MNQDLSPMYSFGRLNPTNPIFAGFVEEKIDQGLYAIKKDTVCRVYSLDITLNQYNRLSKNLNEMLNTRDAYNYDVRSLIMIPIKRNRQRPNKYVCSTFVASILENSGISIIDKPTHNVCPDDYHDLENLMLEYEGPISMYNGKILKSEVASF
jgi:hypothetical protein